MSAMTKDSIKAILSWLDGAERRHGDTEGFGTAYTVILPEAHLVALRRLLELLRVEGEKP